MKKEQIPAFVKEILEAGATLWAAGDRYFFGDIDAAEDEAAAISARADEICQRYGAREHLRLEIAQHLKALGHEIKIAPGNQVLGWIERAQSVGVQELDHRKFAS